MSSGGAPYLGDSGDSAWLLTSSALVLIMTPGLAFFYGGLIGSKNVVNTIAMSFVTISIVTIQWVLVGFSFAFGPGTPGYGSFAFAGYKYLSILPDPAYSSTVSLITYSMFQLMFAIITPAIISGAVAGRMKFSAWVVFVVVWSIVVYDFIAHMVWSSWVLDDGTFDFGWLRNIAGNGIGALDFAGGTVVHMTSGFSALAAALVLGPRINHTKEAHTPANVPFVVLGTALLWFGWFGFNAGSAISAASEPSAGIAFANTHIATAAASLTWLGLDSLFNKPTTVGACSGAVVGLVVITPAAGFIWPHYAIIVGGVGCAVVYFFGFLKSKFLNKYFDDTLDVFTCHGLGGATGAFLTGLFASKEANPSGNDGAFYGNGIQLGYQLVAIVVTAIVSISFTVVIMYLLKYTVGIRISAEEEMIGLDAAVHGESQMADIDNLQHEIGELKTLLVQFTLASTGGSKGSVELQSLDSKQRKNSAQAV